MDGWRCVDGTCVDSAAGDRDAASPGDGGSQDTASSDSWLPDSSFADAPEPDSSAPDAQAADSATPDAPHPDTALPDTALPDTALPDTSLEPVVWVQTSAADFNAGVPAGVDTVTAAGDVSLIWTDTSFEVQIAANDRDTWDDSTSADLYQCHFGDTVYMDVAGLQWPLEIPPRARIDDAVLSIWITWHNGASGAYNAQVLLEDVAQPAIFNGQPGDLYNRDYWSTAVDWAIPSGGLPTGGWTVAPSVAPLLQHAVNRPGWRAGNHVTLILKGTTANGGCNEGVRDFDQSPARSALLHVEYSTFATPGTLASQVLDTDRPGATWTELDWDQSLAARTDLGFEVRADDSAFAADDPSPSWLPVDRDAPVNSGLPSGQHLQWRAILRTAEVSLSPILHEVRVTYR